MAIKGLKERSGSSLQAIKKYIAANYKVDPEKMAPFIKKYLKSAPPAEVRRRENRRRRNPRKRRPPWPRQETSRKEEGRRQGRVFGKVEDRRRHRREGEEARRREKGQGPKSPSKAKKTAKSPTKKPKAPKPKTVKTAAASSKAKKVASPKRRNKRRSTNGGVTFIDAKQESALLRAPHS
ncbi:hypothetical protein HHI36_023856 [Cryptolaemus montrouzieri]|uniref:H15 domain-containing protein n=1 Tax=Cryptolaemus montrouzieri TaxID=559131 RepID=A0ABD2PJG4_9CUCU